MIYKEFQLGQSVNDYGRLVKVYREVGSGPFQPPTDARAPVAKMSRLTYTRGMDDDPNVVQLRPKKPASEARKAAGLKGLARSKATNDKPARTSSADKGDGHPASGMPAGGSGWGGSAKGASTTAGDTTIASAAPRRTREEIAEEAAEMRTMLGEIARDKSQPGMVRVAAIDKYLDRAEGKATAKIITADAADDEAMRAIQRTPHDRAKAVAFLLAKQKGG